MNQGSQNGPQGRSARLLLRPHPARVSLADRRRLRVGRAGRPACSRTGSSHARPSRPTASRPFVNPLAPKVPPLPAKAKSVIFLFMYGGPSHVDTFDYKPDLYPLDGKTIAVKTFGRGGKKNEGRIVGPKWKFHQYGQSGKWVSTLFPHLATCVDDIAFIHSMYAESPIHGSAMLMMNSGPAAFRASLPGHVGQLRPGQRKRKPAGLRRDARPQGRSDQRGEELVERLHARRVPGDRAAGRRRADPRPGLAAGNGTGHAAALARPPAGKE